MRYKSGFTLIEVAVAVAIIGVLATLTLTTFNLQQAKARDTARSSKISVLSDALERYYENHGEYPSARAMVNDYTDNTGDAVASLLSITDKSVLVMPKASSGTTNSIASAIGTNDEIAYVAQSAVGNDNCQNSVQGGCDQYTLSYKEESSGNTVSDQSIHTSRTIDPNTPLQAPNKPTLAVTQSGTNLVATSSTPSCVSGSGTTPRYSFRSQMAGAWSSWSSWQAGNTYIRGSNTNGTSYSFQVHVRCESSTLMSDTSTDSDAASATYYTPPTAPSAPTITNVGSSGNALTTITSTASCNYGTAQYRIDHRTNDGSWTTGSWGTVLTYSVTAADGVKYGSVAYARCVNGTQTATGSASGEASYIEPIAAPAAPTVSSSDYSSKTWTWSAASCASGTSPRYQYRFTYHDGTTWVAGGSWIATSGTTATNAAATSQGIQYSVGVMQQCYNAYTASAWGAQGSGGTFWVPVTHVASANATMMMNSSLYAQVKLKTFTGTCASGVTREAAMWIDWNNSGTQLYGTAWATAPDDVVFTISSQTIPADTMIEVWPRTRCRNTATDYYTDASSNTYLANSIDLGNLFNRANTSYNIACTPEGASSYCAGGYNYTGTKNSTNSTILACTVKTGGISDTTIRYTAKFSPGTTNLCWNA